MKKFNIVLIIVILSLCSLVGCRKLVSTEEQTVEVIVTNEYYKGAWLQPVVIGKATTLITHPARYEITVKYNDIEYTFNNEDTYNQYKDKVGETVIGTLEICTYDDGTIRYNIIELGGE